MGLGQSIVIVNEYTVKGSDGKGSRGSTPGDYVTRYMARNKATESLTPVRLTEQEDYIRRYMARREACEPLDVSVAQIKQDMRAAQGMGGVAFGYGSVSLSDDKLRVCAHDIQEQFDKGKTVMKTVVSFTEEYLRQNGIITDDFEFKNSGDYRGNLDQMKLRMGIMDGLAKMSRNYDDLQYIGVIQVDTKHVHCHLAMVDKGIGTIMSDGNQRGTLSEKSKRLFRRGLDMSLDSGKAIQHMSSNVTHDRRNALCYIKRHTHEVMRENDMPQFLLACLPEDKQVWRAGTNRKDMKKANAIVREYVTQLLSQPDSGYREALQSVDAYAREREKRENLGERGYRKFYKQGQERIIKDCMNGVYSVLKSVPDTDRTVRTPMLEAMSMPYEDMAGDAGSDPMIEFGFKLRSYSSRLKHHKKESTRWRDEIKQYEASDSVSEDSRPVYDFMLYEQRYQEMLMCKYQHFLAFLPPDAEYMSEFDELMEYKKKMKDLAAMKEDKSFSHLSEDRAEEYGMQVYHQHGGRFVKGRGFVIDQRLAKMQDTYDRKEDDFRYKLKTYGLTMKDGDAASGGDPSVIRERAYPFFKVKALDLHHLSYDFARPIEISQVNIDEFRAAADTRYDLFQKAKDYLVRSGQSEALSDFPVRDIELMKEFSNRFAVVNHLDTARSSNSGGRGAVRTIRLDKNLQSDMALAVKATIEANQLENE